MAQSATGHRVGGLLVCAAALLVLVSLPAHVDGALEVASIFTNNAVLQLKATVPVWGWDDPGFTIKVQLLSGSTVVKEGTTKSVPGSDGNFQNPTTGRWLVNLPPVPAASGPYTLAITSTSGGSFTFKNVYVGDVWIVSGQSNVGVPMNDVRDPAGIDDAANYPLLRFYFAEDSDGAQYQTPIYRRRVQCTPCFSNQWQLSTPDNVRQLSALSYYFGRKLQQIRKNAVGIIIAVRGGSSIGGWNPTLKVREADIIAGAPSRNPGATQFNNLVSVLIPYALRGVVIVHGESDLANVGTYYPQLQNVILGWRQAWNNPNQAWVIMQLSGLSEAGCSPQICYPPLRRVEQAQVAYSLPLVSLVVTLDLGDGELHTKDKRPYGERLANVTTGEFYAGKPIPFRSTNPVNYTVAGSKVVITFNSTRGTAPLFVRGSALDGFEVAGSDGNYVSAKAIKKSDYSVEVSAMGVSSPKKVRYWWTNYTPVASLFSIGSDKTMLPVGSFSSDVAVRRT